MRSLLGLALVAVATGVLAQSCPEPSALDVDPAAEPLLLARDAGDLVMTWEDTGALEYRVHAGLLDTLHGQRRFDHGIVAASGTPSATLAMPAASSYFLIQARCVGESSSVGRETDGDERPRGQFLRVRIGVEGLAIFGLQLALLAPPGVFVADDLVVATGPHAPGSPGSPLLAANDLFPQQVDIISTFGLLAPDPSFDAPAGSPVEIVDVDAGVSGPFPDGTGFSLRDCTIRDALTEPVIDGACTILSVDPLP